MFSGSVIPGSGKSPYTASSSFRNHVIVFSSPVRTVPVIRTSVTIPCSAAASARRIPPGCATCAAAVPFPRRHASSAPTAAVPLPQLLDVLSGNMSFVGTRPEAVKYVEQYQPEWNATLLMPAGITSECSIRYKDEEKLLAEAAKVSDAEVDRAYVEDVLPEKMKINLQSLREFSIGSDIRTMLRTIKAVL